MSIPRNTYNIDSTIIPLRSPTSYDDETAQQNGSDGETEVEQWSDDDTAVESEGEERMEEVVVHDDSDEEFRLLHGIDDDGWHGEPETEWDRLRDIPELEIFVRNIRFTHDEHTEYEIDCYVETERYPQYHWPGVGRADYPIYEKGNPHPGSTHQIEAVPGNHRDSDDARSLPSHSSRFLPCHDTDLG